MEKKIKYRFKEHEIGKFNTQDCSKIVDLIDKNSQVLGLTMGQFSLIDLIYVILKKIGKSNIIICTWSAGIKDAHQVKWMLDTKLINDFKIITDHSYVNRQKKYVISIEELFGKENIRTSEIHAKFTLIKNKDYFITILSSMNLNANKTCETFQIIEDCNVYEFYLDFVKKIYDYQEAGFIGDSYTVNKNLKRYFNDNIENKHWSDI